MKRILLPLAGLGMGLLVSGCATTRSLSQKGVTRVVVGPIVLEAKDKKQTLPKFEDGPHVRIVRRSDSELVLALVNRTSQMWKIQVRERKRKKLVVLHNAVLPPTQKFRLQKNPRSVTKTTSKITFSIPKQRDLRLRRLELLLFRKKALVHPGNVRVATPTEQFVPSPTYRKMLTYGRCEAYQQADIFSKWCDSHGGSASSDTPGFDMLWRLR